MFDEDESDKINESFGLKQRFEWDEMKRLKNLSKHRVAFEAAQTVFDDPLAVIRRDPDHSLMERREILLGQSATGRLLLVCYTEREPGRVRIFSARPATKQERREYEKD